MWPICNMAWRIGEILDIREQIAWTRDAGFDGIGIHASPGVPGQWQGIDFAQADAGERAESKQLLSGFAMVEIHAPFSLDLTDDTLDAEIAALCPVLDFAGDLGASIVTVHAALPEDATHWHSAISRLNAAASRNDVTVGLELTTQLDWPARWALPNIGITLDVGHMYQNGAKPIEPFGSMRGVVQALGDTLVHLHMHDDSGDVDHIELGTGRVDLEGVLAGLDDIGYSRGMTLEMNPDRVSPEGIRRSMAWLRERAG